MPAPTATLLTPEEVAAELRVSRGTVYRMIERGDMPAVKLSRGPKSPLRIPSDELEEKLRTRSRRYPVVAPSLLGRLADADRAASGEVDVRGSDEG